MNSNISLTPAQLTEFLLNVATVRPVFIWGQPGIGKSALVHSFAESLGLACVSLLGSQLAPEDLIGVPQIIEGKSRFCPPRQIAREQAYCLFLDELNACSHEVQKAFYSLIGDTRNLAFRAKPLLLDLAQISLEMAQLAIAQGEDGQLPEWFTIELVRDLPRLIQKRDDGKA